MIPNINSDFYKRALLHDALGDDFLLQGSLARAPGHIGTDIDVQLL